MIEIGEEHERGKEEAERDGKDAKTQIIWPRLAEIVPNYVVLDERGMRGF